MKKFIILAVLFLFPSCTLGGKSEGYVINHHEPSLQVSVWKSKKKQATKKDISCIMSSHTKVENIGKFHEIIFIRIKGIDVWGLECSGYVHRNIYTGSWF